MSSLLQFGRSATKSRRFMILETCIEKNNQAKLHSGSWRVRLLSTSLSLGLMSAGVTAFAGLSAEPAAAQNAAATGAIESSVSGGSEQNPASQEALPPSEMPPTAYLQGGAALSSSEIDAWLASPTLNLPGNPNGGVVNFITRLAGSDGRAVLALIQMAEADETPLRINQISRGLARTRNAASSTAMEYASFMDERVAGSTSQRLIEAYQAALQENTAALAAGTVGSGPDGGSLSGNTNVGGSNGDGTDNGTFANAAFSTVLSASYSGNVSGGVTSISADGSPAD